MSLRDVPAALLCGGLGTRLRSVSAGRQKTLVDIRGRPFLKILVDWAARQGIRRFVFCTGYLGHQVREFFTGRYDGLDLAFSQEESPLGTAGALSNCRKLLGNRAALVMNGDSFCPLDIAAFIRFHRRQSSIATVAVVAPSTRNDGGYVVTAKDGRIVSFQEKKYEPSRCLNAGIYALEPAVLDAIPEGRASSLEREVLPSLLGRGVYAYAASQPLHDIGTPDRLKAFQAACSEGLIPLP